MSTATAVELPSISSYGNYSSSNYGAHCLRVDLAQITVWFSYKTPIAFRVNGHERVVRENTWGPTTGKHLNAIDDGDKRNRVSAEKFKQLWEEQIGTTLRD